MFRLTRRRRGGGGEEEGGREGGQGQTNVPDEHVTGGWDGEVEAHPQVDDDAAFCFLVVEEVFEGHVSVDDAAGVEVGQPADNLKEEATGHLGREGEREGGQKGRLFI
jgi:hypothetical protein